MTRCGRPGRTRMPLSGSSVSSTSPTWIVPRPSNTTIACSAPGCRCHASDAPGSTSTSVTVNVTEPKSPGSTRKRRRIPSTAETRASPLRRIGSASSCQRRSISPRRRPASSGSTAARRASASVVPSLRTKCSSEGASYRTSPARTTACRAMSSPWAKTSSPPARYTIVSTPWRCGPISTPGAIRLNSRRIVTGCRPSSSSPPGSRDRQLATRRLRGLALLRPRREDVVLVRPDRAVLVAVVELVAVAQRDALRREERAQEGRHAEDLVADQLEQPADLPLGHRAQAQARHVDEGPQVRRHHEVRAGRVGEDEPGILAGHAGLEQVAVERQGAVHLLLVPLAQRRVTLRDRRGEHRRRPLELHVPLALLVERDAGAMAD